MHLPTSDISMINITTADLNLLRVFVVIFEEKSATSAAQRLNLTQSAVSLNLRRLREMYQDSLFTRTGHGLAPTLFANQVYPLVKDALDRFTASLQLHENKQAEFMGRTITIKIRYASFKTITRSLTLQSMGTCSEEQLYFSAKRLYNKSRGHEPIRLLGLTVSQLQAYQVQGDLFSEDEETKAKVTEAIDKLQKRFGRTAIMKGFLWEMSHEKDT